MKRSACIAAVAVALVGLAGACAKTSKADVTARRLSVVAVDEKATTLEQLDLGKTGFGPGDQLVEEAPIQDGSGKDLGKSYTIMTMTSGKSLNDAMGLIDCSINLADGVILFNGHFSLKDLGAGITIPVIGGTGAYAGAGGTVKMQASDMKKTNMTFELLIPTRES